MALTEKEREEIDSNLTEKEKKEIEKIIGEISAIYLFIEKGGFFKPWMMDSERFMGFSFFHTKSLVAHSITLNRQTTWLKGLTISLLILSIVHIFIILNAYTFKWF